MTNHNTLSYKITSIAYRCNRSHQYTCPKSCTSRDRTDPPEHPPADPASARRTLSLSAPRLYSISPAAVGGGLITPYVIYLLSQLIPKIGSNPSTFAAPVDPHRIKGGTNDPRGCSHTSRRRISIPGDRDPSHQFAQRSHNRKRSSSRIIS